jgi:hypothetical protein
MPVLHDPLDDVVHDTVPELGNGPAHLRQGVDLLLGTIGSLHIALQAMGEVQVDIPLLDGQDRHPLRDVKAS